MDRPSRFDEAPVGAATPSRGSGSARDRDEPSGPVPEPASWAMMIAGFGLTGAMLRRRRAVIAA